MLFDYGGFTLLMMQFSTRRLIMLLIFINFQFIWSFIQYSAAFKGKCTFHLCS